MPGELSSGGGGLMIIGRCSSQGGSVVVRAACAAVQCIKVSGYWRALYNDLLRSSSNLQRVATCGAVAVSARPVARKLIGNQRGSLASAHDNYLFHNFSTVQQLVDAYGECNTGTLC